MKRTFVSALGLVAAVGVTLSLSACDGGSPSSKPVDVKPINKGSGLAAPKPPPLGGGSVQSGEAPPAKK